MSCPIHDRCTCYAASLHYTASLTTSTGSSQLVPQANNIFVGYEWGAPLVPTSSAWYPFESVLIQPPTSHSAGNTHETMSLHNPYHPEPRVYEREQKLASPSREQVCFPFSYTPSWTYPHLVCNPVPISYTVHSGGFSKDHPQQSP